MHPALRKGPFFTKKTIFHVYNKATFPFYGAMLCIRGTSHGPVSVSVCLSVCHKSVFYKNGKT